MRLQQKISSKAERVSIFFVEIYHRLTGIFSEKYFKKLVGKTDIEDALKRLDKLTQEEARMATTQVLKVTHSVDERVRRVTDEVLGVDNRVASVDDRVAGVDSRVAGVDTRVASVDARVAGVDSRVAGVDDRLKFVDDKVTAVIDGAHHAFDESLNPV